MQWSRQQQKVAKAAAVNVLVLLLGLALIAPAARGYELDDPRARKRAVDTAIAHQKAALAETSRELVAANARFGAAQARIPGAQAGVAAALRELAAARTRDSVLAALLKVAEQDLADAEREIENVRVRANDTRHLLGRIAREAYMTGQLGQANALLESSSVEDFASRLKLIRTAMRSQGATIDRLSAQRTVLDIRRSQLDAKRERVEELKAESAANVTRLQLATIAAQNAQRRIEALVRQTAAAKVAVEREKLAEQRRYAQMQAESRRLQVLLARIAAAAAARRRAAAAAAARRRADAATAAATRRRGKARASTFSLAGGLLSRPVDGQITSSFGMRVHPITRIYKLHDGTDFGEACGTPIHAAAAGTVVWAANLAGYGNQLAIDHGTVNGVDLATSYSHQRRFAVRAGQRVARGQVIGYVGDTGYSTGCHLHFMVYANGSPVNPAGWL